jgi:hypothetical protein
VVSFFLVCATKQSLTKVFYAASFQQYFTTDDIIELMGNDVLPGEEEMVSMWSNSMGEGRQPREFMIYDDFVLLMKGQSTETPTINFIGDSFPQTDTTTLATVSEGQSGLKSMIEDEKKSTQAPAAAVGTKVRSAPLPSARALEHSNQNDMDVSPLSINDEKGLVSSYQANAFGDLAPPQRSSRLSGNRPVDLGMKQIDRVAAPGLPSQVRLTLRAERRSKSAGSKDAKESLELNPDLMRPLLTLQQNYSHSQKKRVAFETKSTPTLNDQMRVSVLEASKNFEQQQAEHAKEVLMAQQNNDVVDEPFLVMKHGHKKHVSSELIKNTLRVNQAEQVVLIKKAMRQADRGTITSGQRTKSDMGVHGISFSILGEDVATYKGAFAVNDDHHRKSKSEPFVPEKEVMVKLRMREPTVPGDFRTTTNDPFGMDEQ